jgi:excisionase family DNA binding protein
MEEEEFLTTKEAAELLRIRPASIYNLVKSGRLKRYPN